MRRKAIHEDQYQSPHSTLCFINKYLADLSLVPRKMSVTQQRGGAPQSSSRRQLKWSPPPAGWAKLNVDAAISRCGNKGAAAVVCRDYTGLYLGASALVTENMTDLETLEAMACKEGLCLALDMNLQHVQISTDCLATVKCANEAFLGPSKVIVDEIKEMLHFFPYSVLVHEKRECNLEAHMLAKAATSLVCGRHLWLTGTPNIICIPSNLDIE